jgi:hypothetical protein
LIKDNTALDISNVKQDEEIKLVIQRIQISALLKEIDVEEMRQLAQSNEELYNNFTKIFT